MTIKRVVCVAAAAALSIPFTASAAAASVPAFGPENPASVPVVGPSVAHADAPSVATNGLSTLVVWQDDRGAFDNSTYHIYGALVRPDGSLIEKTNVALAVAPGAQTHPAVAWTGKNYLVVWQDTRNGSADIFGARVSVQGAVLDPSGIAIGTGPRDQTTPAIASDGRESLVVWSQNDTSSGWDVAGQRVDMAGHLVRSGSTKIGGLPLLIAATSGNEVAPAVSYGGTARSTPTGNFLVTWEQATQGYLGNIYAARVTLAGRKLDTTPIPLATSSGSDYAPQVVWNPSTPQWLAVWGYLNAGSGVDAVIGKRIRPQGTVVDGSPIQITYNSNDPGDSAANPTVVSAGLGGYLVLYDHNVDLGQAAVAGTRVTISGQTVPDGTIASDLGDGSVAPVAAGSGARSYVAWSNGGEIFGAPFRVASPSGGNVRILTQSANPQQTPAIARNGHEYLVAWTDARDGYFTSIYATRVLPDGTILDSSGIKIATHVSLDKPISVSSDGADFAVAWSDEAPQQPFRVRVARIKADGTDLDPSGIVVASNAYNASVASDGKNYLVAWTSLTSPDVEAALVTSGGGISPAFRVSTATTNELWPRVASNGSEYLVVWQDSRSGNADVYAARVSRDGAVLDPGGIPVALTSESEGFPTAASDGSDFVVAWSIPGSGSTRVLAAEVSAGGVAGGSHTLEANGASLLPTPALAWTGSTYIAVWQASADATLRSAYVYTNGTSGGAMTVPIPTLFGSYLGASSFALTNGRTDVEIAYARFAPEPEYGGVPRIFMRSLK